MEKQNNGSEMLLSIIFGVGNFFLYGFVLMQVWNWFPAEIFKVTTIGFVQALGIIVLLTFFKVSPTDTGKTKTSKELLKQTLTRTVAHLVIWGIAAWVHVYM